jgi:hypothetical protein
MAKDGGPHWIVVSEEHFGSRDNRNPLVCDAERARCVTFQQIMPAEGWQFR